MNNILITNLFDGWLQRPPSPPMRFANKVLNKLRLPVRVSTPSHTGSSTSIEQRINMYHLISGVLFYGVPGDFVELGCHAGLSAVMFRGIMDQFDPRRDLHLYDSFQGLPDPSAEDGATPFRAGTMATTREAVLANFAQHGLRAPHIHAGWFEDTLPTQLPSQIAFAHLDGDFYSSIKTSLEHVYPRLAKGAVFLVDDYADPSLFDSWNPLPGAKQACDEFLADKPEKISLLYGGYHSELGYGSHGFFRKV